MKIDGQKISKKILSILKEQNITPHLAIILVGDSPASKAYIRQKVLKAKEIGEKVTILNYESGIRNQELLSTIEQLNNDNNVHGIIVQRPLPDNINSGLINKAINPAKDVDAFHPETKFQSPIAKAVLRILEEIHATPRMVARQRPRLLRGGFREWLISKKIVVIGKGETGGGPIIKALNKLGINVQVIDSKTHNPKPITQKADIIISAVGKYILKPSMIKKGVILISVGIYKGKDGKLHGDYEEQEIKNIAGFYTPTPGGVGPVNVVYLLENLVIGAQNSN